MAFLAALPEIAEGAGGAAEAGSAAGAAGGAGATESSGGVLSKLGGMFKNKPAAAATQQPGRQNVGESRTGNFEDAFNAVRSALRPGTD